MIIYKIVSNHGTTNGLTAQLALRSSEYRYPSPKSMSQRTSDR